MQGPKFEKFRQHIVAQGQAGNIPLKFVVTSARSRPISFAVFSS